MGAPGAAQQFVDLDVQRIGIAVLGVLDEEDHEEGNDGGRGIDHQLPGIVEVEERPADRPCQDQSEGDDEGRRPAAPVGQALGESGKAHGGEPPVTFSLLLTAD